LKTEKDRFEKLDSIKAKLFSIIAHDLKNPFNSIIGFSEILSIQFHEIDEETKLKFVDVIYEQSTVTYELLENLLIWARSQTEGYQFKPQKTDIGLLADNSIKPLKAIADKKHIQLVNQIPANTFAFCDKDMILIVLRNLISNAIKFTPEQGSVTIRQKVDMDNVIIQVQDTGVGIEELGLKTLFDPDVQLTTHGTNNESGTGLGLMACKEFVEQNSGSISAKSKADKGSVFSFTLPVYD